MPGIAAYEEPELAIQTTCDSVILTFLSTLGFPQPTVLWRTETGSDITNGSNTTMVLKGGGEHYEVVSEMVLKQSDPYTVTFEMRLELLNQSFSRSVSLHPLPGRGQILRILSTGLPTQGTILQKGRRGSGPRDGQTGLGTWRRADGARNPDSDCCGTPVEPRNRLFLLVPLLVVLACLAIPVFRYKSSLPHGPGKVDVPVGTEQ
ncbi:hypothetical protein COCON_G00000690 [Conger conger]|uniref:Uncharacterized protein n=1 Tax=Conger conger TaxID=82655 RepID=A0A9Q1E0G2_CONCO|nr:hypothetical protein COCON_G00000690 [Conger conger]